MKKRIFKKITSVFLAIVMVILTVPTIALPAGAAGGDGYVTNADVLRIYRYIYDPVLYPIG